MIRILARRSWAKILLARSDEPDNDMSPNRTHTNPKRYVTVYKKKTALHASQHDFHSFCCFRYKASLCRQFRSVLWRSWLTNNRDVVILRIRLFQCLVSVTIKIKNNRVLILVLIHGGWGGYHLYATVNLCGGFKFLKTKKICVEKDAWLQAVPSSIEILQFFLDFHTAMKIQF